MSEPTRKLVGVVFEILGKEASVRCETSEGPRVLECYLRGRLFEGSRTEVRNQVAVGDEVEVDPLGPLESLESSESAVKGVIHAVRDRRSALVRLVGRKKPLLQVVAANVDQIVVVSALEEPPFKTGLIDRYLAIAHHADIRPALCINKIDLGDEEALLRAKEELAPYRELGYPLVLTSAKTVAGIDELRELLKNRRSVLTGHSGVGKSELAGGVQPGLVLPSASVDRRGRGRHTTSRATLVSLDFGGELVDTPGVRELSIRHIDRHDLPSCFIEFRRYLGKCHFPSCSHIPEPYCAVRKAVEDGKIARERYDSYCRLYEELG